MSKLTDFYGRFRSLYSGDGTLNGHECRFEIGQQHHGRIALHCSSNNPSLGHEYQLDLVGLAGGKPIRAVGKMIRNTVTGRYDHYFASAGRFEMTVGHLDWNRADCVQFAITNFQFSGNEYAPGATGPAPTRLSLCIDGTALTIEKVDNYEQVMQDLTLRGGAEVTCELTIRISDRGIEEILQLVDAICCLLTIARGTKINWISHTLRDDEGVELGQCFRPRITRAYTPVPLVKPLNDPASIVRFLRQCYPIFVKENPHYHFDHLGNFLADVHSRVFLETRCLLLFSVVEVLARRTRKKGKLRKILRDFVDCHELPLQKCKKKKCGRKCGTCEPKCDRCQHQCGDDCDIGNFVNDRNKMVHGMEFSDSDFTDGYYRNLNLLHLMILRALDYRGEYYDRSKGGSVWA